SKVRPGDTLILSLSGHGLKQGKDTYFAPVRFDPENAAGTGLPWAAVLAKLEAARQTARAVWVLADCCRASPGLRRPPPPPPPPQRERGDRSRDGGGPEAGGGRRRQPDRLRRFRRGCAQLRERGAEARALHRGVAGSAARGGAGGSLRGSGAGEGADAVGA